MQRYAANRLRVVRQVRYSLHNENNFDLVLFLNGTPVASRFDDRLAVFFKQRSLDRDRLVAKVSALVDAADGVILDGSLLGFAEYGRRCDAGSLFVPSTMYLARWAS